MKKIHHLFLLLATLAGLTSCNESSNSYDVLAIYPILADYHIIYADQTEDTVVVYSTRDWTATCSTNWLSMSPFDMSGQVGKEGYYSKALPVLFRENTTEQARIANLQVTSNGKKVDHPFFQTYWLNIEEPAGNYSTAEKAENLKVTFTKVIDKDATSAPIAFTLYNGGTLSSDAAWAVPDSTTFEAGPTETNITCETNQTGVARTAHLTLTSASGISTVIQLQQNP